MKAKLFQFENEKEIRLSNGVQFFSNEDESKEDFVERVTEVVDRDYVDTLEIDEVDEKKLKKRGSAQLEKSLESASGVEAKILESILVARGVISNETPAPEEIEVEAEEVKAPAKPKAKKESKPKAKKEPKVLPSLESVIEAAALAKNNVSTICSFVPFRQGTSITGEVKQVVIDRRVNKAYYRITGEDKKLYHTEINNPTFTVDEDATEKMLDEREAAAAKKKTDKEAKAKTKKAKAKKEAKPAAKKETKAPEQKAKGWRKEINHNK